MNSKDNKVDELTEDEKVLEVVRAHMLTLAPQQRKSFDYKLRELIKNYEGIPF